MTLRVDGVLPFGEGSDLRFKSSRSCAPAAADLEPARIAARGAAFMVDSLVLKRDVYYTLDPAETDYSNLDGLAQHDSSALFDAARRPDAFPRPGTPSASRLSLASRTLPHAGRQQPLEPRRSRLGPH